MKNQLIRVFCYWLRPLIHPPHYSPAVQIFTRNMTNVIIITAHFNNLAGIFYDKTTVNLCNIKNYARQFQWQKSGYTHG